MEIGDRLGTKIVLSPQQVKKWEIWPAKAWCR
jgi:hypothetical protein